ncbi:hypothetical protein EDC94DRAFT_592923 [Helicostylum pulchrum]|nr:hypothetical protein EDC94DRAFT_592923 [Helicostylum pulchrum]
MPLDTLPNEIFSQILALISWQDQKTCMLVSPLWHLRFRPSIIKNIRLNTRHQFKYFLSRLQDSHKADQDSFGLLIRRLTLGTRVGIINSEFNQLPILCPFLEYFDFNPNLWRYFTYTENVALWGYLSRFPCMHRLKLTVPILRNTGRNITQLEMSPVTVDELPSTRFNIISILRYTPNLISLQLYNGIVISQNISISELESIHNLCPRLESLQLKGFDAHLLSKDCYYIDIDTLPTAPKLKRLHLDMSINSEDFLHYWAHKYPHIESLDIQLRLLEPEYYHEAVQPENSCMKEAFATMATQFKQLQSLTAYFDEKYFPCDVFLRGINSVQTKMKHISIHFSNFDYHRRSARNFKLLVKNSQSTMKHIDISNWDRSWDYEHDILIPMGQCPHLESLSLSPLPGALTEFDIDIILDYCTCLKKLSLAYTYNLFISNDEKREPHPLQELSLRYTMVNNKLFNYLAMRCPHLDKLDILHMTKPFDNNIQVQINMPHNSFKYIHIAGLQLGLRIQDSGFQCIRRSVICSLEEIQKSSRNNRKEISNDLNTKRATSKYKKYPERWYHLYQPKQKERLERNINLYGCGTIAPRLQRLRDDQAEKIKSVKVNEKLWEQVVFAGARIEYESKRNWELDIPFGFTSVRCLSVDEFKFEGVVL